MSEVRILEIYPVRLEYHDDDGNYSYSLTQDDFEINIYGPTLEKALEVLKEAIEQEGVVLLETGENLPKPSTTSDSSVIYIQTDIEHRFKQKSASNAIRKNVSLPAWMDIELKKYNVDASKLFQEAVLEYLRKRKWESITDMNTLKNNVDNDLLEEYGKEYMRRQLKNLCD